VKPERTRSSLCRRGGVGFEVFEELADSLFLGVVEFRRTKSLLQGAHGVTAPSRPSVSLSQIGEGSSQRLMIPSSQKNEFFQSLDFPYTVTGRTGGAGQKKEGLLILA
jgi:hypothetical protein